MIRLGCVLLEQATGDLRAHGFYLKLGFEVEGDLFMEVGGKYNFMKKQITL